MQYILLLRDALLIGYPVRITLDLVVLFCRTCFVFGYNWHVGGVSNAFIFACLCVFSCFFY